MGKFLALLDPGTTDLFTDDGHFGELFVDGANDAALSGPVSFCLEVILLLETQTGLR